MLQLSFHLCFPLIIGIISLFDKMSGVEIYSRPMIATTCKFESGILNLLVSCLTFAKVNAKIDNVEDK